MSEIYQQLLTTPEWRAVRADILKRDGNRCQSCHNKEILKNLTPVFEIGNKPLKDGTYLKGAFYKGQFVYLEKDSDVNAKLYFVLKDAQPANGFLNYVAKISADKVDSLIDAIKNKNPISFNDWEQVKGLHVHHSFYREGCSPWNYNHDSLITYCANCHGEWHNQNEIKILDVNGYVTTRKILRVCEKCAGTGYLPQYIYHMDGICFQCNGTRYI